MTQDETYLQLLIDKSDRYAKISIVSGVISVVCAIAAIILNLW